MVAEVQQNFGNPAHANSADSDKVNMLYSLEHTRLKSELPSSSRRRGGYTIKKKSRSFISSCRRGGLVQEFP